MRSVCSKNAIYSRHCSSPAAFRCCWQVMSLAVHSTATQCLLPGQQCFLIDWHGADDNLATFVRRLIELRREHAAFRRNDFCREGSGWYRNDGEPMTADDWNTPWAKAIGVHLDGSRLQDPDDDFYIAFNSHSQPLNFTMPRPSGASAGGHTYDMLPEGRFCADAQGNQVRGRRAFDDCSG